MARKKRMESIGFYHIINRGVEQRKIFMDDEDNMKFLEILQESAEVYRFEIYAYVLMYNHYHLLLKTSALNLSLLMRQINAKYSMYFNKKYKRSGHLWQGRFKSWYVRDEAYLYTLMLYIEQNPLKAKMVKALRAYPYSSYHYFLDYPNIPQCLQNSWIVQNHGDDREAIKAMLESEVDSSVLQELKKASSLIEATSVDKKPKIEKLIKVFSEVKDIKERNKQILKAYQQGYSQHNIAKVLGISQPAVYGVIKRSGN
jgi:REP element-mobilizing transposase RayT